jgi:choline dehydrogenase-like flavoprotein
VLIDARTIPNNHLLQTDVCIIGAGAAGITLAMEFAGQPCRVLLLESGGLDPDPESQALYKGKNIGLPYFPLDVSRLRYFGGTTNHWGGMCRPFDEIDFERREWIPDSGWPFPKSVIDPFYKRALPIFQLRHYEWTPNFWAEPDKPLLPLVGNRVITIVSQQIPARGRLRFGRTYGDKVIQAANITTCLHANVTRIEANETGKKVNRVRVASLSGNKFSVTAKLFILAAGGIENARLLLLSNNTQPRGLGNQNDLVGRFFLEHPNFIAAIVRPSNPQLPVRFYQKRTFRDSRVAAGLELSEEVRRGEKLVTVGLGLETIYDELYAKASESKGLESFRYLLKKLWQGDLPDEFGKHLGNVIADFDDVAVSAYGQIRFGGDYPIDHIRLAAGIDPAPNRDSRVTLGTELDPLG